LFLLVLCLLSFSPLLRDVPAVLAGGVVGDGTPASCSAAALEDAVDAGGEVTFNCGAEPHTIVLATTLRLSSDTNTTIDGGNLITLSGGGAVQVIQVEKGGTLTLQNITITGGNNSDDRGGGVYNNGGTLVINNAHMTGNAALYGAGIANRDGGVLTITNSVITNNSASEYGGGVHTRGSTTTIINSSIVDNSTQNGDGAGLFLTSGGSLQLTGSIIADNVASSLGGGIAAFGSSGGGDIAIANTTIARNSADQGGAIHANNVRMNIVNTTIAANSAVSYFAGIEHRGSAGSLALTNTIIANDPQTASGNCGYRDGATSTNGGGNIQFPGTTCGEDILTTDPLLLSLADNGGPTWTMSPGAGSPAIDGGVATNCPATDQRGVARPADGDGDGNALCDSGAYEVEAGQPPPAADNVVGDGTPASCTEEALRAAVMRSGTITFNCGEAHHTIVVSDDVVIAHDTVIDGGGSEQGGRITLSGGDATRVLFVETGVSLTLRNLTIANGKEPAPDGEGGGVFGNDRNTLTIVNSILRNNDGTGGNSVDGGGAIFSGSFSTLVISSTLFQQNRGINGGAINTLLSSLTVIDSTFESNESLLDGSIDNGHGGGAIYIDGASDNGDTSSGGRVSIRGSTFRNNSTAGQGGAVFSWLYPPDDVVIAESTFVGNTALTNQEGNAALGGAVYHGNGPLTLSNTTFANNTAVRQGGALWPDGRYPAVLTNVTFAGNRAVTDEATGNGGLGGAIAGNGNLTCIHCTLANNHAGHKGGAIFFNQDNNPGHSITLINTILDSNTAWNNGDDSATFQHCADDMLVDGGGNVQFPAKNARSENDINCTDAVVITDPLLLALGAYGGATHTMALAADSPAIDMAGDASCPSIDQRGVARPVDGDGDGNARCDSGAYEYDGKPHNPDGDFFIFLPFLLL
jgi:hypothetical protein